MTSIWQEVVWIEYAVLKTKNPCSFAGKKKKQKKPAKLKKPSFFHVNPLNPCSFYNNKTNSLVKNSVAYSIPPLVPSVLSPVSPGYLFSSFTHELPDSDVLSICWETYYSCWKGFWLAWVVHLYLLVRWEA